MGILEQMKALSVEGQPQVQITRDGSNCSASQIMVSPSLEGDISHCVETMGSQVQLPEDILHQIHALMPLRDAAQAACVSRGFLRSWRCFPNLIISVDSLGINENTSNDEIKRDFVCRVDHIMQNHSSMGVKRFVMETYPCSNLQPSYVDRWLQCAITPGIKEIYLSMFSCGIKYNFPGLLLFSREIRSSIQTFVLGDCSFRCAAQVGYMSSLTNLALHSVHITGEELYGFLSNSCAVEQLRLTNCNDIICLKIPCLLQKLDILHLVGCSKLEMIDSNAPNLSTFFFAGRPIHILLGEALQVRKISFFRDFSPDALYYASTKFPFIAPNLQTLVLSTSDETVNTPKVFGKFIQLKYLEIEVSTSTFSQDYDLCSLISFLDASPALESLIVRITQPTIRRDSVIEDSNGYSRPQCLQEQCHDNLKNVMITGFCSAKSMIELTICIIEKSKALACLTLDTTRGYDRRLVKFDKCLQLDKEALVEAKKARVAIQRYIEGRVPPAVKLKVIEPCSKCIW
ncbi:hypothetical protein SEVIR_8G148300v4 [Setaria viridis]|uniref:F-box domain-containing protein n=3 Tax=Setaria viridis TaxID=4556 RepID=A0A4U6TTK2_SETVI|nr:uncharacterized protein LOC117833111 isoform X1 [Setaria viridis]TKW00987.1 hypothetical protein SEVIR_8G148300v2 [Setaria viridis]